MYVYVERVVIDGGTEYTVGHYAPGGTWVPHSTYGSHSDAGRLVNYLNGGTGAPFDVSTD